MSHLKDHITIQNETTAGRLRLRLARLRSNAGLAARLNELAKGETAWFRAEVLDGTGSIILHHDPAGRCQKKTGVESLIARPAWRLVKCSKLLGFYQAYRRDRH